MSAIVVDLASPVIYVAGEVLDVEVTFIVPSAGTYYIVGALYANDLTYITGSLFGIMIPTDEVYGINSATDTRTWVMVADEEKVLATKLTLDRTGVVLGLFLMELVGETASFDDDIQVGLVELTLIGEAIPAPPLDLTSIMSTMVVIGMMGMMTGGM